jgi:hypothetical protein
MHSTSTTTTWAAPSSALRKATTSSIEEGPAGAPPLALCPGCTAARWGSGRARCHHHDHALRRLGLGRRERGPEDPFDDGLADDGDRSKCPSSESATEDSVRGSKLGCVASRVAEPRGDAGLRLTEPTCGLPASPPPRRSSPSRYLAGRHRLGRRALGRRRPAFDGDAPARDANAGKKRAGAEAPALLPFPLLVSTSERSCRSRSRGRRTCRPPRSAASTTCGTAPFGAALPSSCRSSRACPRRTSRAPRSRPRP